MRSLIRLVSDLGPGLVLSPERHVARPLRGAVLSTLLTERRELGSLQPVPVLDTTHVKDGVLDVPRSGGDAPTARRSVKKRAFPDDLLISRLRPYLRQVALVTREGIAPHPHVLVSTEFYVLRADASLAFLLPVLLSPPIQRALCELQEGGHHPRVPLDSLLSLRVPFAAVKNREPASLAVMVSLARFYAARSQLRGVLASGPGR